MPLENHDQIVGAIALNHIRSKYLGRITEPEFDGGFHVLSGFNPKQLAGFATELQKDAAFSSKITIQFPAENMAEESLPAEFLTDKSAVDVRNRDYNGKLVIAAELEKDAAASLAECDRTDAEEIRSDALAEMWVDLVSKRVGVELIDEAKKQLVAATKGLFSTARSTLKTTCAFLCQTLRIYKDEAQIGRAAGRSLPSIGIPLFRNCFNSIPHEKLNQPSTWAGAISKHAKTTCYLHKRDLKNILLDVDKLRDRFTELKESQDPPMEDALLDAFSKYIETKEYRCPATEKLLFEFDWELIRHCFDKTKTTEAAEFVEKTRQALKGDNLQSTEEEDALLESMAKQMPKAGNASEEVTEFFNKYALAISQDPRLLSQWESFIHGSKVTCTNLLDGIVECIERSWNKRTQGLEARIRIIGKKQQTHNQLKGRNPAACEFFERNYAYLPQRCSDKILFQNTIAIEYSKHEHQEWFKGKVKKSASKKANLLEFEVFIEESTNGTSDWNSVDNYLIDWIFNSTSILGEESADFQRLAYFLKGGPKTALVESMSYYEGVGTKGTLLAVSLENTEGLSDSYGAGGRGSLVPAKTKATHHVLAKRWVELLEDAQKRSLLSVELIGLVSEKFVIFQQTYDSLIRALAKDALVQEGVVPMVESYRQLVFTLGNLPHEALRRGLLKVILSIGNSQIPKSGSRPSLAIICPWHPLRIEATAARARQFCSRICNLLGASTSTFSDGSGKLFFREFSSLLHQPLYPEITVSWDSTEPKARVISQALGGYSLHEPPEPEEGTSAVIQDQSKETAKKIEELVDEYLRLQPHERDNLSLALYDCDSASLPSAVVNQINRFNENRKDDEVTCQVFLMHRDEAHLRTMYRELMSIDAGVQGGVPTEATGDFLSRVRVNIVAAKSINTSGRGEPIDIAFCKDIISRKAKARWKRRPRTVVSPDDLEPHQWSRRLPVEKGIRQASLHLCCPALTEAGWTHLYAIASLMTEDSQDAWEAGKCPMLMKILSFDSEDVRQVFDDTHKLATWVVNEDEMLDRRLLEAQDVKVIRYIQSSTQGKNLVISSKAKGRLLFNTLKEKLKDILPADYPNEKIEMLAGRFINEANQMSGGLVLKAARRAKNTNELLGMVLSRFLVQTEIGLNQAAAWCFLDDYSAWLGKKDGAQIADLLVLSPMINDEGSRILDIVVTEAKFIQADGLSENAKRSEQQLRDTLRQIEEALIGETPSLDQSVWLSRISDMLLTRLDFPAGQSLADLDQWRTAIRNRKCQVRIRGYSHIFVHSPVDSTIPASKKVPKTRNGVQEFFSPSRVRELILAMESQDLSNIKQIRDQSVLEEIDLYPQKITEAPITSNAAQTIFVKSDGQKSPPLVSNPSITNEAMPCNVDGINQDAPTNVPTNSLHPITTGMAAEAATAPETSTIFTPGGDGNDKVCATRGDLLTYLQERSKCFATSNQDGLAWLKDTGIKLKSAFYSRQLPFKLAEGFEPILTPNAGIFRVQGSINLTVPIIESKSQEIYTSEGIQIIAVTPEPGRLRLTVTRPVREMLHTEVVLRDFLANHADAAADEKLLVGIREEDGSPLIFNPYDQPHTLIAGSTGSGKSVLMQNIILSIAATRSPEESKIFLIDPKYGVDYGPLQSLPHILAGSNGIVDDQQTALDILNEAVQEMERRYQVFKEVGKGIGNIRDYRKVTGKPMPTWWIIHDEFADWMQIDEYREEIPKLVNRLSVKARAAGIFLIFAAQRPDNTVFPIQMRDQLGNRLILKVQSTGTSEIALGEKGAEKLLGKGHMLAKLGGESEVIFAQVPFIDPIQAIPELVDVICAHWEKRLV